MRAHIVQKVSNAQETLTILCSLYVLKKWHLDKTLRYSVPNFKQSGVLIAEEDDVPSVNTAPVSVVRPNFKKNVVGVGALKT